MPVYVLLNSFLVVIGILSLFCTVSTGLLAHLKIGLLSISVTWRQGDYVYLIICKLPGTGLWVILSYKSMMMMGISSM